MFTKWFAGGALLLVVVASGFIYTSKMETAKYFVSDSEKTLIGKSSVDSKFIKESADSISYNRTDEVPPNEVEKEVLLAAAAADSTGNEPYQAVISKDSSKGIEFSDAEGKRPIKLVPQFDLNDGRYEDGGHVVFPASTSERHHYTFKRNGLKSDIVLTTAPSENERSYSWQLELDSALEARMLPDGGVGIYSANQYLYGDLQVSDEKSQQLVDNAKKNGVKDVLVYVLPAPFITDSSDKENYNDVSYTLKDNTLTLTARNLKNLQYPLTIDPTIVVTTTSDFQQNTGDTGNIDYSTDDEITRGDVSGSPVTGPTTQQTSAFTTAREAHTSVVYNGYLYIIGGDSGSAQNDIQYCPLNSDGSVGTCTQQTSAFTTARYAHTSVVHNGYLYIIGGFGVSYYNDIQYCPINSDGSVGTCTQQSSAFTTARRDHTSVVWGGYLYIIGGYNGSYQNDIQYCPINANGSVGTCTQQTSAFTTARYGHSSVVYNGYLYIIGGDNGSFQNDIQYCPINSDGSVGTCTQQSSAFTSARRDHTSVVSGGYLYIVGGISGIGLEYDISYCPLNPNGSVGTCTPQDAAFTIPRETHTSVIYNGYLYIIGGYNAGYRNDIERVLVGQGRPGPQTRQTSAFTTTRFYHTSVVHNGYLYIIGGWIGGGYANDIQYCPINVAGSVGACTQQAAAFTTSRGNHTSVVHNGYLYIIGGDSGSQQNDIQYCPINSNGSVGACTQQTSAFTTARSYHRSVVNNGYLYIIGGFNGSRLDDIQYCPINSNGSVGTCTQQTSAFTTGRSGHTSVVHNGYLYIIGGFSGSYQNDIQYCPINSNGSVGTCTQQTSAFTTARTGHTSVVHNGYLYIVGGNGGSRLNDIQYCPINSNGSVGTCTQKTTAFTTAREYHSSAYYNGFLYIIGGSTPSAQNDIQRVQLGMNNAGQGSTTQQTSAFTTTRFGHTSVVYNGYIYIIGGYSGSYQNDIQYCPLNSNGSVGTCTQQTSAFTTARDYHTSVVHNGYLYIIGGYNSSYQNDIQYCPLNSNGSVDTCTQQTSAFTTAREGHTSVVHNGYLYIIGGYNNAYQNDIQYCPLNSNGSVGTCTQQTSAFTTARQSHTSVVYNGYLYIIGGDSGSRQNDIQYCPLNSNGSVGTCTQQTNAFTTVRSRHSSVVYNGNLYIIGGYSGSGYLNDIHFCPINSSGSVDGCKQQTSAFTTARLAHSSIVSNGFLYIIGGFNGSYHNDIQYIPVSTTNHNARYERVIDVGSSGIIMNSFTVDGATNCNYTVSYKLAGSDYIFGSTITVPNVVNGQPAAITGGTSKRYILLAVSLNDSTCGGATSVTSITLTYNDVPEEPTLLEPVNGATDVSMKPRFRLGAIDDVDTYLQYKIELCSNSDCSSILRTIDQTLSQTGWVNQDQQSNTAYSSATEPRLYAIHNYQQPILSASTQYWWRAYAIDPGGNNAWSSASSISTFTTGLPSPTLLQGGTTINGGTIIN